VSLDAFDRLYKIVQTEEPVFVSWTASDSALTEFELSISEESHSSRSAHTKVSAPRHVAH
jgi:hypothetical protein